MKLLKKVLCCIFIFSALTISFGTDTYAATGTMRFNRYENGYVTVLSGTHKIYDINGRYVNIDYVTGESFYYSMVYEMPDDLGECMNVYASYYNNAGQQRFVKTSSWRTNVNGQTIKTYVPGLRIQ